jgi:hypothetical protein
MEEEPTDVNLNSEGVDRVTISEAAALLGVHPNTVRSRVKDGTYNAEKVVTERGPTWMIDRNSLATNTLPSGSQHPPSQRKPDVDVQATDVVRELLRPFVDDLGKVREELGAERVRREQAERERDELLGQLEALREARESPETRLGDSEGTLYGTSRQEAQESLERPERRERSWWRRLFGE